MTDPAPDICGPTGTRGQPDHAPLVCTLPAGHRLAEATPMTTVNNLDAIASLPFSALSSPDAGEQIRDSLIAEIRGLRSEVEELRAENTRLMEEARL